MKIRMEEVLMEMRLGTRIGFEVTPESVGAVIVRGGTVKWSVTEAIGDGETASAVIERILPALLEMLPSPPWPRPRAWIAIDDPCSSVKTIRGLPPITDARALAQVIAATPERFFLGVTSGLVTTGIRVTEPGTGEAAAFEAGMLEALCATCAAAGVQVALVAPAEIAVAALPHEEVVDSTVNSAASACLSARAATLLSREEPVVVRPSRRDAQTSSRYSRRLAIASAVAMLSLMAAVLTPTLIAMRTQAAARRVISSLALRRAKALLAERDMNGMTAAIATVESFEQHRLSKTLLLSQLTQALPATAVVTTLKIDTAGITLVALAPHAAAVVQGVGELPGASKVEMLGPVTRESQSGLPMVGQVEQVTVRFRMAPDRTVARRPLVAKARDGEGGTE
jgi:hypothetical protein